MTFETTAQGWISQREPGTPTGVAAGSRCVVTSEGELACTFMVQSKLGCNDFKPVLARSADGGLTWTEPKLMWPHLAATHSLFGSIGRAGNGELTFYGSRYEIDVPGEPFWSEETQGLKQNTLFWAKSTDHGHTWTDPTPIALPIPGTAETAMAMTFTRDGHWVCCYSPYNSFDPAVVVDRNQVVALVSTDEGATWRYTSMLRYDDGLSAESWIVELADGRMLGTSWHLPPEGGAEYPNAYALSHDGGLSWSPTRSTGILGQSTALAALPDGRALFIYNQRKHGDPGIRLALVRPTETDFGIEADEMVWQAEARTQSGGSGEFSEWTDYSFGEPSITPLPDGTLLVTFWCVQNDGQGIRYIKLNINEPRP